MLTSNSLPQPEISHHRGSCEAAVLEQTIGDALRCAAERWPDCTALIEGALDAAQRRRWTYSELLAAAERCAWTFLSAFRQFDAVALWAPNCAEWVFLELGAALAGVTLVTVNPAYLSAELVHVLAQSRVKGLVMVEEHRGRDLTAVVNQVRSVLPDLRSVFTMREWEERMFGVYPVQLPLVHPDDIAQIQYTSGTTGFPKGAELTHRGLSNNARFYAAAIGARSDDVWINPMPMFHTAGCGLLTLGALQTGGAHVLPASFDPELMLELFESERGTLLLSVPTMLIRMLDAPSVRSRDLKSWRLATLGGAPVPPELVHRAAELLGIKVAIGYGQTECSPYITHTAPDDPHPAWWETVGRPLPQTELKVIDICTGAVVPTGETGEVCARSACVMKRYFRNEAATAAAIDQDGWLHTGDLGALDEMGYLRIQGRLKDMIIRGGENIYPREIEDVLFAYPAVMSAAVVGVPDSDWGEVPVAFVQLRDGHEPTCADLEAFCRAHLASYKVPRIWRFVVAFPQTASGKIQKFALQAEYLKEKDD